MRRLLGGVSYLVWLTIQVVATAAQLGWDALTPGLAVRPRIVKYALRDSSELETALLASSITITPGTLVVGVAPACGQAPPALFVHALYGEDESAILAGLADMERRLHAMTRGRSRR